MLIYMSVGVVPANLVPLDWLKIVCAFELSPGRPCVAFVSTDAGLSLTAELPTAAEETLPLTAPTFAGTSRVPGGNPKSWGIAQLMVATAPPEFVIVKLLVAWL